MKSIYPTQWLKWLPGTVRNPCGVNLTGNTDYMIRRNYSVLLTISLALSVSVLAGRGAGLKLEGLKCEYRVNPLGLDTPQPRLSWLLESRGQRTEDRGQKTEDGRQRTALTSSSGLCWSICNTRGGRI